MTLVLTGCGSGSTESSDTSGLDGSKTLTELTNEEKGQFCDWAVNKFGGYGASCDSDWAFMSYPDRESCIEDGSSSTGTPKCRSTVKQAEACVNSLSRCASFQDLKNSSACSDMTAC